MFCSVFKQTQIRLSTSWKRVVFKGDMISSCPYTFWAIEKMLEGIKNYEIYLEKVIDTMIQEANFYKDQLGKVLKVRY